MPGINIESPRAQARGLSPFWGEMTTETVPLQKLLQRLGHGSRSTVRRWIETGRVRVDGQVVTRFAEPIAGGAQLMLDDLLLGGAAPRTVLLMNKPKKHVTAREDDFGRDALSSYLPEGSPYLFPVGRLDYNSEGALLWTNDGGLARRVLHPQWALPKVYGVKIRGHLFDDHPALERMRDGMSVDGEAFLPVPTRIVALRTRATWVEMTLHEGKSRQIRRMCRATGLQIVKLRRLAIGPVELGTLNPRCVRALSPDELLALDRCLGLEAGDSAADEEPPPPAG